jgi:3'(2'),5'-bisphosphate nucleotidase
MIKPLNEKQLVQNLCHIAFDAGKAIMDIYDAPDNSQEFTLKGDNSPVTKADYEAERIILKGLARAAPNIATISEEAASMGQFPHIGQRFFLVDPLDGTREFLNHNGEFTVNIALIENNEPLLGVVYAPALGRMFFATSSEAFESRNGAAAERIMARNVPDRPVIITSRSHKSENDKELREKYNANQIMMMGSSVKFCLIATGEADLYPRQGRTMLWDIAAGHAVLRAAGGDLQTDRSKITYGTKPLKTIEDCANPPFLAHGALGTRQEEE